MDAYGSNRFVLEHFLRLDTTQPDAWLSALQQLTHSPIISQKLLTPLVSKRFRARLSFVSSYGLNASGIYLSNSSIVSGTNAGSVTIIMPVAGRIDFESKGSHYVCDPWKPFVLDPYEDFRATVADETHMLVIQLKVASGTEYRAIIEHCQAQLVDVLYMFLCETPFLRDYQHAQQKLENLNSLLLELIKTGKLPAIELRKKIIDDRRLCKAILLMNDDLSQDINIESIAINSGLSLRSLHYLMQNHIGQSPYQYIRGLRLIKAREAIIQEHLAKVTIAQHAIKWGFLHTGRFSSYYHAAFGELPKDTLSVLAHLEKPKSKVKVLREQADNIESYWLVSNSEPAIRPLRETREHVQGIWKTAASVINHNAVKGVT